MKIYTSFLLTIFFPLLFFGQNPNGIGDTLHAIHYDIHLTEVNTDSMTITGYTQISLVPKTDGITSLPLDFLLLTTDSVFVNGNPAGYNQTENILRINLTHPVYTTDTLSVTVYYHGYPFHENWGGFHFSGDYSFNLGVGFESIPHNLGKSWFPCIDDFTDRATYDLHVTVNDTLKAIGGGTLADTVSNGDGTTTWHWNMPFAIPTYLISIATGDYVLYRDTFPGSQDSIPITIYTRPQEQNKVSGSFVHLKDILTFYESHFGPYPFQRVGYTGTAIGAMEHATNIFYPHFAINGTTSYESLYAHELSHMWFGDEVTCDKAEEMWLNEGWASFCEMYYKTDLYGSDVVKGEMRDRNKYVLQKTHFIDQGYWALDSVPQAYTYGSTSYDKGAVVVYTLKNYLGDSLFFNGITAYLQANAWNSRSSADMRDFLTDYTGIDMAPFFEAWVSTPGTPHFSIDSTAVTGSDNNYRVDIYLKQKYKGADFLANNNILEIGFADEHLHLIFDTIRFSGKTGHSVKELSFSPKAVLLDPEEKTCDATTHNYKIFSQKENYLFPDTYFKIYIDSLTDSALIMATHHWVGPDSLKQPVPGLRLSENRYWSINGVFEDKIQARGRFYYDHSDYLDGDLIRSADDSVVLLYRRNPSGEWHAVEQTREGIWSIGYIYTEQLKKGEYTLAAWDLQTTVKNETGNPATVTVFPNPSSGKVNIFTGKNEEFSLKVYDVSARLLKTIGFSGKRFRFNAHKIKPDSGILILKIYGKGKLLKTEKLILK